MAQTVLGIFENQQDAEDAIKEFKDLDYDPKNFSIVMKDAKASKEVADHTGANVAGGAVSGATTGAIIGALAGLLVGIGAIAIPGIGAVLIGGPLAAALGLTGAAATTASGAVTGAVAGGLIGALMAFGLPEHEARHYEERIKAGGILLAVPTLDRRVDEVEKIFQDYHAVDVKSLDLPEEGKQHTHGKADMADHHDTHRDFTDEESTIEEPTSRVTTSGPRDEDEKYGRRFTYGHHKDEDKTDE